MDGYLSESNKVKICGEYDVIVVGGGVAGVAAALAARRQGLSTLVVEKSVMLGGLATLGHIVVYLPLCDGTGKKVIGGIAEELLHLSIKYGYGNLPKEWASGHCTTKTKARYMTVFNAPAFVLALDEIIKKEGVELLFDTVFCSTVIENGVCKAIIVENKSGRQAYNCKMVVDTTGDADVMFRAGAECVESDNWLTYWGCHMDVNSINKALDSKDIMKALNIMALGGSCDGKNAPEGARKYIGTDVREVTEFILEGRKMALKILSDSNKNDYSILALPGMAQFRTTRRIIGLRELTSEDVFKHAGDSVGCAGDWRKEGPVYEIPYGTLISRGVRNIITAGRTIAAQGDAWEVTRVIPVAALTGQAAGTAAALAVKQNSSLENINITKLQQVLAESGVIIHY